MVAPNFPLRAMPHNFAEGARVVETKYTASKTNKSMVRYRKTKTFQNTLHHNLPSPGDKHVRPSWRNVGKTVVRRKTHETPNPLVPPNTRMVTNMKTRRKT